ncbi:MAG: hypothetical protein AAFZ09_19075 [Pseudomonadota bacterium]
MLQSISEAMIARTCRDSLVVMAGHYEVLQDGIYLYRGPRPTDGRWHRHGYLEIRPRGLLGGVLTSFTVRKQRWTRPDRSKTQHSRPPDDLGRRYDALVIAVTLLATIDAAVGLHRVERPYATRRGGQGPSVRTVQRWLSWAQQHALRLHHALRWAAMERCEPRPETLFPRGRSPPVQQQNRRWRDPSTVDKLWQGLAMVLKAASSLNVPTATLLAEARGRWTLTDPLRNA